LEISIQFQQQLINALAALKHNSAWWESGFAIGILTASTAILTALLQNRHASKIQARQSEIEKALKLQDLQLNALKALSRVAHEVTPREEPSPDADSHEWLAPVVGRLGRVITNLNEYLLEFGHISPPSVCVHIDKAIEVCNKNKWGHILADSTDYEPSTQETAAVLELIKELENAIGKFKIRLSVQ